MRLNHMLIIVLLLLNFHVLSYASGEASGPQSASPEQSFILPGPPTILDVSISARGLYLSWEPSPVNPDLITGYEIVRSDGYQNPYITLAKVDSGILEYKDESVSPEIIYIYKIRALVREKFSEFSNLVITQMPLKYFADRIE